MIAARARNRPPAAMSSTNTTTKSPSSSSALVIPQTLWDRQIPVYITHATAPNAPFVTAVPRFSYLSLLLPRLAAYFGLPCSSFHYEDVLLRNLAVGLLVDLYQPTLPWRLTVGAGESWDIGDTFLNSAKEVRSVLSYFVLFYGLLLGCPCACESE